MFFERHQNSDICVFTEVVDNIEDALAKEVAGGPRVRRTMTQLSRLPLPMLQMGCMFST